jgi:undecaprenyl-diphosphatase
LLGRIAPLVSAFLCLVAIGTLAGRILADHPPRGDLATVDRLEDHRSGTLNFIAVTVSHLGSETVLAGLAFLAVGLLVTRRRWREAAFVAVASVGGFTLVNLLKFIVERPRPPYEHVVVVHSSAFPSEHALGAFVVYLALAWVVARSWPGSPAAAMAPVVAAGLAALVGLSRVYLGIHYPSDILGSLVLGGAWVAASAWTFGLMPGWSRGVPGGGSWKPAGQPPPTG